MRGADEDGVGRLPPTGWPMRQSQTGFLLAVLVSTISISAQRCKRINIGERLRFSPGCAIVATQLPSTNRCQRSRRDLASYNGPVLSSFSGFT
jgi:hypothetical protein